MPGATRERFAHAHVTATGVPRQRLATFRDEFRIAIAGSATAGANGSFAGVRCEINWNGVLDGAQIRTCSPPTSSTCSRRAVSSSQHRGTGFMVSANAGQSSPVQFGLGDQLETFSAQ